MRKEKQSINKNSILEPDVVAHTYNLSIWEAEASSRPAQAIGKALSQKPKHNTPYHTKQKKKKKLKPNKQTEQIPQNSPILSQV